MGRFNPPFAVEFVSHDFSLFNDLSNTAEMKTILSVVFSVVVASVLFLVSRLWKVRQEMRQLVRDHRFRLFCQKMVR
jgi:hypothetical protein